MLDAECYNAVIPEPATILRQRLHPFCLGHAFYLHRLEVQRLENIDDLFLAVYICCHSYEEIEAALNTRFMRLKIWFWRQMVGSVSFVGTKAAFLEYSQIANPQISWRGEGNSVIPILTQFKTNAQSFCGYSPKEALSEPINAVLFDVLTYWETQNQCELLDDDVDAMFDAATASHDQIVSAANRARKNNSQ